MTDKDKPKARFITPPNRLLEKTGKGGFKTDNLQKAEAVLSNQSHDAASLTQDDLNAFSNALSNIDFAKQYAKDEFQTQLKTLHTPIMQIKANAGMFRHKLLSEIADIALLLLDTVKGFNKDNEQMLRVVEHALKIAIESQNQDQLNVKEKGLIKELDRAFDRYLKKHSIKK